MKMLLALIAALAMMLGVAAPAQAAFQPVTHVVLIVEENTGAPAVTNGSMPYLVGLGNKYAHTTGYKNIEHPSLPNYMDLTAGSNLGCLNDSGCKPGTLASDNIFHQTHGQWQVWAQSMPGFCHLSDARPYVVHHTAAPYFSDLFPDPKGDGTCSQIAGSRDIPFPIKSGQTMSTNKFIFVSPDLNHDAHDGTTTQADNYLKTFVPTLLSRSAYINGSTVIEITFDETGKCGGCNTIYTAVLNPRLVGRGAVSGTFNHYSLLRMNEELLGLPLLRNAQTATNLRGALGL